MGGRRPPSGTLQVLRTPSQTRTGPVEEETKSGNGRRMEIHPTVVEILKSHRKRQRQKIESVGDGYQDRGLLFASVKGTPVNRSNLRYLSFKPILERVGLNVRFRDLRYSYAAILFMKGQYPKEIQERLGHSRVSITLNIYGHVIPGRGRRCHHGESPLLSYSSNPWAKGTTHPPRTSTVASALANASTRPSSNALRCFCSVRSGSMLMQVAVAFAGRSPQLIGISRESRAQSRTQEVQTCPSILPNDRATQGYILSRLPALGSTDLPFGCRPSSLTPVVRYAASIAAELLSGR